jgi:TolB-like protein/Flp pilus assembly protein TadD
VASGGPQRVFFSYASADRPRIAPIVRVLSDLGHSVWWDSQITGGAAYTRAIEAALEAAEVVVVAWSKTSVNSDWVRDEASFGRDRRRLVPLLLDDAEPPLGFRQYQLVRFGQWKGQADAPEIEQLLAAIAGEAPPERTGARRWARAALDRRLVLAGGAALVPALAAGGWWLWKAERPPPAHSIAVLPFANLSGDASQDYFSDGLSEELINALARLKPLQVVARTSAFRFKGVRAGASEIGAKLNVAYILDGSVRREGALVRVGAQLVEVATGFERWTQTFDRDLKDILAVQSEIAQAVAEALKIHLLGADIAAFSLGGASNAPAYDDYLRGRRIFDGGGDEAAYRAALARFDAAIAGDPGFAAAHAARARTLLSLANEYTPPARLRATYDDALGSARRAVALAPDLAEAQATLGGVLTSASMDFAGARQAYARALATGSGSADILTRYGQFSYEVGDFDRGLPAVRRAAQLDPLNPRVFRSLGYALIAARLYGEGIAAMRQALALKPSAEGAHAAIGDALLLQGDARGALDEYGREPLAWLGEAGKAMAYKRLGDGAAASAAFKALASQANGVTLYQQAQVLAQWGESDRAIATLLAAQKAGDGGVVLVKTDPMMDPLRGDARFAALVKRLGLDG